MKLAYYIKPFHLKVAIGKEGYLLIRKESHLWLFFFREEKTAPYPYMCLEGRPHLELYSFSRSSSSACVSSASFEFLFSTFPGVL